MAIDPTLKTKAIGLLELGKTPREVSEKLGIGYQTVLGWKKKLDSRSEDDGLSSLVEVDEATLTIVADRIKEEAPAAVAKKVDKLVEGVVGLQKIDEKFRTVVYELLEWAELQSQREDLSVNEWKTIGTTISSMYTAIFSKNVTNVNVMNNTNISSDKREIFKASLRS